MTIIFDLWPAESQQNEQFENIYISSYGWATNIKNLRIRYIFLKGFHKAIHRRM